MPLQKKLLLVAIFSIAMGYLESAVVVYMREILYPHGFSFPLAPIPGKLSLTELFREAATLVMLAGIAWLAGRNFLERFAWFLYSFGLWDIFYYVFLKILINWPDSLLTWDILFLIPVTWTGPVIAPVIISLIMIATALTLVLHISTNTQYRPPRSVWILLITGAVIVFVSFVTDYSKFILLHYPLNELWSLPSRNALFDLSLQYVPATFPWIVFVAGIIPLLAAIVKMASKSAS